MKFLILWPFSLDSPARDSILKRFLGKELRPL
jgi:hypothetical protein